VARESENKLRERIKELAQKHPGFGLRTLHEITKRENLVINHKRTERIYKEEKLSLRLKKKSKRLKHLRIAQTPPDAPLKTWSMDFVHDRCFNGRKIKCLMVIDQFSKKCPMINVGKTMTGADVAKALDSLKLTVGLPEVIFVDNGPEFAGKDLGLWSIKNNIRPHFIGPGKPTQNAFIESFNGKMRLQCLNQHWFSTLEEARVLIEEWRKEYNSFRPHSSLNGLTPDEFTRQFEMKKINGFDQNVRFKIV
jgi:putative transposase